MAWTSRRNLLRAGVVVIIGFCLRAEGGVRRSAWVAVDSSSIAALSYDAESRVLGVQFRSGAAYRYREVPAAVFAEFLRADSKGRYFAKKVRGKYAFVRVQEKPS
jgi:hypothetical protein